MPFSCYWKDEIKIKLKKCQIVLRFIRLLPGIAIRNLWARAEWNKVNLILLWREVVETGDEYFCTGNRDVSNLSLGSSPGGDYGLESNWQFSKRRNDSHFPPLDLTFLQSDLISWIILPIFGETSLHRRKWGFPRCHPTNFPSKEKYFTTYVSRKLRAYARHLEWQNNLIPIVFKSY